jgi:hypothetical protein
MDSLELCVKDLEIKEKTKRVEYPPCPDRNICSALGCPVNIDPRTCLELSADGRRALQNYVQI